MPLLVPQYIKDTVKQVRDILVTLLPAECIPNNSRVLDKDMSWDQDIRQVQCLYNLAVSADEFIQFIEQKGNNNDLQTLIRACIKASISSKSPGDDLFTRLKHDVENFKTTTLDLRKDAKSVPYSFKLSKDGFRSYFALGMLKYYLSGLLTALSAESVSAKTNSQDNLLLALDQLCTPEKINFTRILLEQSDAFFKKEEKEENCLDYVKRESATAQFKLQEALYAFDTKQNNLVVKAKIQDATMTIKEEWKLNYFHFHYLMREREEVNKSAMLKWSNEFGDRNKKKRERFSTITTNAKSFLDSLALGNITLNSITLVDINDKINALKKLAHDIADFEEAYLKKIKQIDDKLAKDYVFGVLLPSTTFDFTSKSKLINEYLKAMGDCRECYEAYFDNNAEALNKFLPKEEKALAPQPSNFHAGVIMYAKRLKDALDAECSSEMPASNDPHEMPLPQNKEELSAQELTYQSDVSPKLPPQHDNNGKAGFFEEKVNVHSQENNITSQTIVTENTKQESAVSAADQDSDRIRVSFVFSNMSKQDQPAFLLDLLRSISQYNISLQHKKKTALELIRKYLPHINSVESIIGLYELVQTKHAGKNNPFAYIRQEQSTLRFKYGNTATWQHIMEAIKSQLYTLLSERQDDAPAFTQEQRDQIIKIMKTHCRHDYGFGWFRKDSNDQSKNYNFETKDNGETFKISRRI